MNKNPAEYFNLIKSTEFITSGDDVDWAVVVSDQEKIIRLIFEESTSKRDWINNFNFPIKIYKKQESCLRVARGWGNAYKSCNDVIMEAMIKAVNEHPDYDCEILGWSYGGAMAVIASEDFYFRTKIRADIITFGAPKPLWGRKCHRYVTSCVNNVWQFAHINDCVPLCPPLPGYKMLKKCKIGSGFSLIKLFKPNIYHLIYGDKELYF